MKKDAKCIKSEPPDLTVANASREHGVVKSRNDVTWYAPIICIALTRDKVVVSLRHET